MGADKYLLFPAWQGNEWEGRGTHCDRGVRDADKPAGSFLPHWHLKPQYTIKLYTGTHPLGVVVRESGDVCVYVWVCDGDRETEREGMGKRDGWTVKKTTTERGTGPEKKKKNNKRRVLLKGRVEMVPPF